MPNTNQPFIPARESAWFIFIFDYYVRLLFRRRFKNILIDQQYQPGNESRTIYFLNHTSWWDGLIPLLLNQKLFRQNARAMMEDKQMLQHKFFSRIGAFSVNLEEPRSAVRSLRYAAESMKRTNSSLFIFPEGRVLPFSTEKPDFKKGLGWIAGHSPGCDLVPVGICIHTARHDKPELFIRIGKPVDLDQADGSESDQINTLCEKELQKILISLEEDAYGKPDRFRKL
ncbi:MAG: lysophospholipid acyltransferase family protein [Balneolaceae bacterium]|nr:lysophospholipid acyltransferase family protein [Balneolaceae bacterium]